MDDDGRDLLIAMRSLPEENQPAREVVLEIVEITSMARHLRDEVASRERLEVLTDRQTSRTDRAAAHSGELQAANEVLAIETGRLRSANEELLVANEEAQAAAEEIETLNEELQATNEELETLNEELQATVEELTTTNDELQARTIESQNLAAAREADRQRLEDILQGAPIGMSVMDGPDHIYRLSNLAALEQLGRTEDEVLGRAVADVQPELVKPGVRSPCWTGSSRRVSRSLVATCSSAMTEAGTACWRTTTTTSSSSRWSTLPARSRPSSPSPSTLLTGCEPGINLKQR